MRKLLIALLVLAVLFIAVDRIALVIAEDEVASRIATAYSMPVEPGVSITGFPFLTQVVSGDYSQIGVTADQIQADGVTLNDLNVHLTGVHATISQLLGGSSTITADRAAGTALVNLATVKQRLPQEAQVSLGRENLKVSGIQISPDGKNLKLSGTASYLGISAPVSATAALSVSPSGITVTPEDATVAGGLISIPGSAISRLHFTVPLSGLPLHLHITSVQVTPDGLRVGAAARNVQFART
jgi:LmeA-like phospholipid-binding